MNFLHRRFEAGADDLVEVTLDGQANVMLLDDANFENYRSGKRFRYVGGVARSSPYRMNPPAQGFWNLVIDLGGRPGRVVAGYRLMRNEYSNS